MPVYEFIACDDCPPEMRADAEGRTRLYELDIPMSHAPRIGEQVACEGGTGHLVRIASMPQVCIREALIPWDNNNPTISTCINGEQVNMQFVDHPHTDSSVQRMIKGVAARQGVHDTSGVGSAYYSDKHGKVVVDVASNIPDPLGAMQRATVKSDPVVRKFGTPVKKRKAFKNR